MATEEESESEEVSKENILDGADPYQVDLPGPVDPDPGELLSDEDTLDPDDDIDSDEVAAILDDNLQNEGILMEVDAKGVEPAVSVLDGGNIDDEESDLVNCDNYSAEETLEPSLMSESLLSERPRQERSAPARLNLATGENYNQISAEVQRSETISKVLHSESTFGAWEMKRKDVVHHVIVQVESKEVTLEYAETESRMLATYIDAMS